jgi:hypothetical protein
MTTVACPSGSLVNHLVGCSFEICSPALNAENDGLTIESSNIEASPSHAKKSMKIKEKLKK